MAKVRRVLRMRSACAPRMRAPYARCCGRDLLCLHGGWLRYRRKSPNKEGELISLTSQEVRARVYGLALALTLVLVLVLTLVLVLVLALVHAHAHVSVRVRST